MSSILVTGAGGLIGRRGVAALRRAGHEVIPVGRADADLLAPSGIGRLIDEWHPDTIVHLAWSASSTPGYRSDPANQRWAEVAVEGAERAISHGIRFIGTGTGLEDAPADDAYSVAKVAVRAALASPIASGAITWLRPFYVFDEAAPSPAVLRAALAAKAAGKPVRLATPRERHDFVHAIDVGEAIATVVGGQITGSVDVGAGVLRSVAEFVGAFGCAWEDGDAGAASPGTEAAADIASLVSVGWSPVQTLARLG